MVSGIGPHCADGYNDNSVNSIRNLSNSLQPAYINIMRGQNPDQALWIADELARGGQRTFIRHRFGALRNGDETTIKTFPNPRDYFNQIVVTYPKNKNLYLVAGNEITLGSYSEPIGGSHFTYVGWNVQLMRYAHDAGYALALFRFPSWHPNPAIFNQFDHQVVTYNIDGKDPIVVNGLAHAFQLWPEHILSPNVYYTDSNFSAINDIIAWWDHLGKPTICIGEFGWLANPHDARSGFRTRMSQKEGANNVIDVWKKYFKSHNIPVCYFNKLVWHESNTFEATEDFENVLLERRSELQITPHIIKVPTTPQQPEKPMPTLPDFDDPRFVFGFASPTEGATRLRSAPDSTANNILIDLRGRAAVRAIPPDALGNGDRWGVMHIAQHIGWIHWDYVVWDPESPTIPNTKLSIRKVLENSFEDPQELDLMEAYVARSIEYLHKGVWFSPIHESEVLIGVLAENGFDISDLFVT